MRWGHVRGPTLYIKEDNKMFKIKTLLIVFLFSISYSTIVIVKAYMYLLVIVRAYMHSLPECDICFG